MDPAFPHLVKIGYTQGTVEERIVRWRSTGVPDPFEVVHKVAVRDPIGREREAHSLLQEKKKRFTERYLT